MSSRLVLLRLRSAARCSTAGSSLILSHSSNHLTRPSPAIVTTLIRVPLPPARPFTTSQTRQDAFNVQDEQDFKDKVTSVTDKPIVVEFHAVWCGPCKQLMPRLEKRIATTQNKVDLAKVDIDDLPDLAMEYGVNAVPSVIAFMDGKIVDKFVGVKDEDEIDVFIKKLTK